jgi:hypothetical protein
MAARTPAAGAGCTAWLLGCVGGVEEHAPRNDGTSSSRGEAAKSHFPTLSGSSVDEGSSWDGDNLQTSDEELLEDLELVLEGRGLVSTIFLPPKSPTDTKSVPRTAFIRSKPNDSKIECQVVVDNDLVANGTLKRFKFSVFDVVEVSKGRNKNSVIPAQVADEVVMRFTILKKGELHFVFESQHVRDDIVQGFKLLIAKKVSILDRTSGTPRGAGNGTGAGADDVSEKSSAFGLSRTNPQSFR